MYVGDPNLNSEHALDRELLSLGITEGKRHTAVVNGDLSPDTLYRWETRGGGDGSGGGANVCGGGGCGGSGGDVLGCRRRHDGW